MQLSESPSNIILIICGPAGSGKTTLCDSLLKHFPDAVQRLVTTTSRPPRPDEVDGVDYHFLESDVFEQRIAEGAFIEWARVHGRYYGSQKTHVEELLQSGTDILLNIDIQGAAAFYREAKSNPTLEQRLHRVFIKPQSMEQLRQRLSGRGESEQEIERRLKTAREEIKQADSFDHVIISDTKEADFQALEILYKKLKNTPQGIPGK